MIISRVDAMQPAWRLDVSLPLRIQDHPCQKTVARYLKVTEGSSRHYLVCVPPWNGLISPTWTSYLSCNVLSIIPTASAGVDVHCHHLDCLGITSRSSEWFNSSVRGLQQRSSQWTSCWSGCKCFHNKWWQQSELSRIRSFNVQQIHSCASHLLLSWRSSKCI